MAADPQTLGRYQLERVLGKGAMGIVYEALDPKLHRKVAIKTILISQLDEETAKDFSMRFVREAHAGRHDGRHARLYVARANPGATHRPAHRYFFGGHHPVPVFDRPEAVYGGGRMDGREEDHPGRSPDAVVDQRGAVAGVRPGGGQGAGEESRPALCDRARIRARG